MEILKKALTKVDRPGVFCTYGKTPFIIPGLRIKGKELGNVGFPLQKEQAEKIKKLANHAPFGKGMETVMDLNVRNVWELDPADIVIDNPEWENMLRAVTANIGKALGVNKSISCHSYKLLLYEKGSFFLPHKDTEKEDRMFATLTITLPSSHQGGDFIIAHEGETATFSFDSKEDLYYIQYAAFYADCMHEVKPVTDGYRLTLVYNLTYSGEDDLLKAPKNNQYLPDFIKGLKQLRGGPVNKFVIPLEHEYTEKNLSFQNLKNLDQAKAELLLKAARETDFIIYLAFIHHWESGMPTYDEYDSRDYHYHDHAHEDTHDNSSSYDMEEVYDQDTYIDHWVNVDGKEMMFGKFPLEDNEFILDFDFNDQEPYQQDYEGYAGNYGPTLDQIYRRTALIVWPKEQHFVMLAEKGQTAAISALGEYFDRYIAAQDEKIKKECKQFASLIMDHWKLNSYGVTGYLTAHKGMLEILLELYDPNLLSEFIEKVMFYEVSGEEGPLLVIAGCKWGWSSLTALHNVPERLQEDRSEVLSHILREVCTGHKTREKEQFCYTFFRQVIGHILHYKPKKGYTSYHHNGENNATSKINTLAALFAAASWLEDVDLITPFLDHLLQKEDAWNLDDVVLPFLIGNLGEKEIKYTSKIVENFSNGVKEILEAYLSIPLKEPADWVQNIELACICQDCRELQAFVLHPEEKVHCFRVNKNRRQHLHEQIDRQGLDVSHVTERSGSPYTLVCTKTRRTWEKLKKQRKYREDCYKQL